MRIVVVDKNVRHIIDTGDMAPYERAQCLTRLFLNKYGRFKNDPTNRPRKTAYKKHGKARAKANIPPQLEAQTA